MSKTLEEQIIYFSKYPEPYFAGRVLIYCGICTSKTSNKYYKIYIIPHHIKIESWEFAVVAHYGCILGVDTESTPRIAYKGNYQSMDNAVNAVRSLAKSKRNTKGYISKYTYISHSILFNCPSKIAQHIRNLYYNIYGIDIYSSEQVVSKKKTPKQEESTLMLLD